MASLSEIAKKHGVTTEAAEPEEKKKFGKRRPWSIGDIESSESREGKPSAKVEPKLSQSEAKVEPTKMPETDKLSQSWAKVEPQVEPKLGQSEAKVEPNPCSFAILVGLQRCIIQFVFDASKLSRDRQTDPMAIGHIAEMAKTTVGAARKAIQRLEKKGVLMRPEYKDGRGGWSRYEVSDDIFREMILGETRAKVEPK